MVIQAFTEGFMVEPASEAPDPLEVAVEQAIAVCDGDLRAASRAASFGFARGRTSPARRASERLERWREISAGSDEDS
jgi:hypothetical protein